MWLNSQHASPSTNTDIKAAACPIEASYDDSHKHLTCQSNRLWEVLVTHEPSRGSIKEDLDYSIPHKSLSSKTWATKSIVNAASTFFFNRERNIQRETPSSCINTN